jgi:hypothetical protein
MPDAPIVNIGQNSPEKIAYDLMIGVLNAEKVTAEDRTRKLILDTYAECILAVRGNRTRTKK